MKKDVSFDCTNCNHHNEITLSGISDFLPKSLSHENLISFYQTNFNMM